MRTLKTLAFVIVSCYALLVTDGCGKSGGKTAPIDAAPADVSASDVFTSGSGGASVASGGASGTGGAVGISTGGTGSGGIGAHDAAVVESGGEVGISTGGTGGSTVIGLGGGGGTSTGGTGGSAAGGSGGGGAGGKDASPGGTGGIVMTGGSVGRGGTIGSGGSSASSCPQEAPANGAVCNQLTQCYYENCATSGRTVAGCSGTSWQVTTGACSTFNCGVEGVQVTCSQGQICLANHGKAPVCVSHTCGTGAVTTECVPGADPGASGFCRTNGSPAEGITMFCCSAGGTSC